MLRWRTGLILREIETEIRALEEAREAESELTVLMGQKVALDERIAGLRLARQRMEKRYGPGPTKRGGDSLETMEAAIKAVAEQNLALDGKIAPLARAFSTLGNPTWGPLMRAASDKSLFARQVERYADIYTSRVSNFLAATPFAYLRAARGSLPHDLS
jgi:hypothetical protein